MPTETQGRNDRARRFALFSTSNFQLPNSSSCEQLPSRPFTSVAPSQFPHIEPVHKRAANAATPPSAAPIAAKLRTTDAAPVYCAGPDPVELTVGLMVAQLEVELIDGAAETAMV